MSRVSATTPTPSSDYLAEPLRVGEPTAIGNLTIFPLFGPEPRLDYISFAQGREEGVRDRRARGRRLGQRPHGREPERRDRLPASRARRCSAPSRTAPSTSRSWSPPGVEGVRSRSAAWRPAAGTGAATARDATGAADRQPADPPGQGLQESRRQRHGRPGGAGLPGARCGTRSTDEQARHGADFADRRQPRRLRGPPRPPRRDLRGLPLQRRTGRLDRRDQRRDLGARLRQPPRGLRLAARAPDPGLRARRSRRSER